MTFWCGHFEGFGGNPVAALGKESEVNGLEAAGCFCDHGVHPVPRLLISNIGVSTIAPVALGARSSSWLQLSACPRQKQLGFLCLPPDEGRQRETALSSLALST